MIGEPTEETRLIVLPRRQTIVSRLLLVVHCDRGNTIRIISARLATLLETRNSERGY